MIVIKNRSCVKKHVIGGSGIFSIAKNLISSFMKSGAAKKLMLSASKGVAEEAGKRLVNKILPTAPQQTPQVMQPVPQVMQPIASQEIKQKAANIISKYTDAPSDNSLYLNKLINGSGARRQPGTSRAISIQDYVRLKNGSGLKLV